MNCLNCGKEIPKGRKYCSNHCQAEYQYKKYIIDWKSGKENGVRGKYSISKHIKRYLFTKYDNKCSKCNWDIINQYSGRRPLEIEHIDGNYKNNKEKNLTLFCPNCHSLTSTYKSLNMGNGRKARKKYSIG